MEISHIILSDAKDKLQDYQPIKMASTQGLELDAESYRVQLSSFEFSPPIKSDASKWLPHRATSLAFPRMSSVSD
ncbi:hypothetical protein TNIN_116271 [Trichonephila inaurata madagascariensis]|uniref:Uncharacterized protein n=1 Tax=Trichonephila inaurata madagascariensis TaxID=2747483 RepID=A0A8X6WQZ4_9ARAC|nr:hypothetical protein TNIN_116271 [Trichonephila inaurata madagascariensis]